MKVSIITVVKNRKKYISSALESVFNQTYRNIEHIIIDGKSTDGTLELITKFKNKNIIIRSGLDKGIYYAMNKGLEIATGDIIGFMHSDDFFASNDVIENVVNEFDENIDAIYGDLQYVSRTDNNLIIRNWVSSKYTCKSFYYGWMPPHPTLFIRRNIFLNFGGFDTSYNISSDYDLIIKYFYKYEIKAKYIPLLLIKMRVGGVSNGSFPSILRKIYEDYIILRSYKLGGGFSLLCKNIRKFGQFIG